MSLRGRVLALTGLAFVTLVVALYGSLRAITHSRFADLEAREVTRDVERAAAGLRREIDGIETLCSDWAQWNDTYRFMVEDSSEFVDTNLVLASVANLDLDAIVFVRPNGEVRHAVGLNRGRTALQPVPPELVAALADSRTFGLTMENPRRSGLVTLPGDVMEVAARAILTSEARGPSRGTLIMGRFMTSEGIRRLGTSLRLSISAQRFSEPLAAPDAINHAALESATIPVVVPMDRNRVCGLTVLRDLAGKPSVILRVEEPRTVFRHGMETTRNLLLALVLATCLIAGVVLLLLEHSVLAPLASLGSALESIAASGSPSGRVPVEGRDELATVAKQVNTMLEALETSRERLQASEARFRHLVETAPDVIFTVVARSGRITSVSPAFERLTGWKPEVWIGRRALRLVAPPDRERALRVFATLLAGEAIAPLDVRVRNTQGALIDCDIAATREMIGAHAVGILGVARDITRRKQLEAEVVHAQKIQAIGMLTGGVAHDFNNLLQAQTSLAQLLRWRRDDTARQDRIVQDLEALIRRGAALTRQLLIFARKDVSKQEELDLGDVLRDGTLLAQRLVRENVSIQVTVGNGRMPILGDRGQLGQVLLNLVTNAADAMPDGGRLRLRAGRGEPGEVYIEVTDTGVGISDEVKTRLFEPFFTTKQAGHGTGLGLAVVDSIVTTHGGRVAVQSAPGAGSTFRVTLPLRIDAPAASRVETSSMGLPPLAVGRGERVLLVE
ncbi:MAG TPA: CHASE4 domain-containing protein, partial [Thermoanaerobaculaceae bacterium]|nr:CHASE4 domain-containing protein [Thermoanaerobaculaceae bacterium]